jgi:prepilin-type N-terminal cleavage/methylation domain-containing protein
LKFNNNFYRNSSNRGFTLIELLVVIALLGIIAAIAIPNVTRFLDHGVEEAANTEVKTIHTAALTYTYENGLLPDENVIDALDPYIDKEVQGSYEITQDEDSKGVTITGLTYPGCSWDGAKWVQD